MRSTKQVTLLHRCIDVFYILASSIVRANPSMVITSPIDLLSRHTLYAVELAWLMLRHLSDRQFSRRLRHFNDALLAVGDPSRRYLLRVKVKQRLYLDRCSNCFCFTLSCHHEGWYYRWSRLHMYPWDHAHIWPSITCYTFFQHTLTPLSRWILHLISIWSNCQQKPRQYAVCFVFLTQFSKPSSRWLTGTHQLSFLFTHLSTDK